MISKRRRTARHHEITAQELLAAYHAMRPVDREGGHTMLRWLVIARAYRAEVVPTPECPMDAANAYPTLKSAAEVRTLEQRVAARVFGEVEQHVGYLEYAAAFFRWWYRVAATLETPAITQRTPDRCPWLQEADMEKSLVVPDVRRGAVSMAQVMEMRAGEFEVASTHAGGRTRSVSAALQTLRTGEWNNNMHSTLMYGTLLAIYHAGFLDALQLSIVDSRYQGRLGFAWATEVLRTPSSAHTKLGAWPIVIHHGPHYIVLCHDGHVRCASFAVAYSTWYRLCMDMGGILAGRYDIRKCTI